MLQKKSKLEDRPLELTQLEQQNKKKDRNNEESLRDLWYNIKCTITLQGSKEKRERDRNFTLRNNHWKLLQPDKGNRYPSSGSIGSPKQDKTEETYTKTHYYYMSQSR